MKRWLPFVLVFVLSGAAPAERWSAEQQEVLDHMMRCWDAAIKASAEKNRAIFDEACPCSDEAYSWNIGDGAPTNVNHARELLNMDVHSYQKKTIHWKELRPVAIAIDGDVVLVHFYSVWLAEHVDGTVERSQQKRFEVWRKKKGKWIALGAMGAPASTE